MIAQARALVLTLIALASTSTAQDLREDTSLAARYRSETRSPEREKAAVHSIEWVFERGASVVQVTNPAEGHAERWSRDEAGRVWYVRIFHREKKIVEYRPSDLKLGAIAASWDHVRNVVEPELLNRLTRTSEKRQFAGQQAAVWRGTYEGAETELWWLDGPDLPAHMRVTAARATATLDLVELTTWGEAAGVPTADCGIRRLRDPGLLRPWRPPS